MHTCHATDCEVSVPPEMWGCRTHWFMVPKPIRDRIWRAYRVGQCDDMNPSADYCEAAKDAVIAVAQKEGRVPDTRIYDAFIIDQLSGLALRKALCEALGWKWTNIDCRERSLHGMPPGGDAARDYCAGEPCAPALESDPGVFWPEFEKWALAEGHEWQMSSAKHRLGYSCAIWLYGFTVVLGDGASITEAGCRAWLKALKEKHDRH